MTQRTEKTQQKYEQAREVGESIVEVGVDGESFFNLSRTSLLEEFEYWAVIANDFPYDKIFTTHDLLIPKRPFNFIREATDEERHEYYAIKKQIDETAIYESIIENFSNNRSAPGHFHAHLVAWKE